jgi:hypothetical protein
MALQGISLAEFNIKTFIAALQVGLGFAPGAVDAEVQSFDLSTTLSFAGGATSLTADQRATVEVSLAASLFALQSQVQVAPTVRRRNLLQSSGALEVRVTVAGLAGGDAPAAMAAAARLAAPATLATLVSRLGASDITGATTGPVEAAAQLLVVAQVPTTMSFEEVEAALGANSADSLTALLRAAGITVASTSFLSSLMLAAPPPFPSPPPPAPPPPSPPPSPPPAPPGMIAQLNDTELAVTISFSLFFGLLVYGAAWYWVRRKKERLSEARRADRARLIGKTFTADDEDSTNSGTLAKQTGKADPDADEKAAADASDELPVPPAAVKACEAAAAVPRPPAPTTGERTKSLDKAEMGSASRRSPGRSSGERTAPALSLAAAPQNVPSRRRDHMLDLAAAQHTTVNVAPTPTAGKRAPADELFSQPVWPGVPTDPAPQVMAAAAAVASQRASVGSPASPRSSQPRRSRSASEGPTVTPPSQQRAPRKSGGERPGVHRTSTGRVQVLADEVQQRADAAGEEPPVPRMSAAAVPPSPRGPAAAAAPRVAAAAAPPRQRPPQQPSRAKAPHKTRASSPDPAAETSDSGDSHTCDILDE